MRFAPIISLAAAQQAGSQKGNEYHPPLHLGTCTKDNGCQKQERSVVLDANWRWVHKTNDWHNCYTGSDWD
jgi:cellulose 1,4-beta-cellobiosidase